MTHADHAASSHRLALEQAQADFLAACPAEVEGQQEPTVPPYPLVSVGEVLRCPPLRWRVKGLIPARGIGQIYGASTAGKSFLSLDLAVHVARGAVWYGHKTKAAPVVIFSLEGQEGTRNRLAAYIAYHGEDLPPNLSIGTAPTTFYKPEDLEAIAISLPDGCLCIVDNQQISCAIFTTRGQPGLPAWPGFAPSVAQRPDHRVLAGAALQLSTCPQCRVQFP